MRKYKIKVLIVSILMICFPITTFAEGTTDVYVGVTNVSKSNFSFLVVDEKDIPIEGASIDLWTNDKLEYQLLGVSQNNGIYDTTLPFGDYKYKVYKVGYETVEQQVSLPSNKNPHIEKIILKRAIIIQNNETENYKGVSTFDSSHIKYWLSLFGVASLILIYVLKRKYQEM